MNLVGSHKTALRPHLGRAKATHTVIDAEHRFVILSHEAEHLFFLFFGGGVWTLAVEVAIVGHYKSNHNIGTILLDARNQIYIAAVKPLVT